MRALVVVVLVVACRSAEPTPMRVAAAADLQLAFEELGQTFTQRTGTKVTFTFGSTGLLATQLKAGAPFDVFAAASVEAAREASSTGVCDAQSLARYATGSLVLLGAPSLEALREPSVRVIALAQPEHAPYGVAAKQALERSGLWGSVERRVVYAQNVGQTLQYFSTGNADAAFVSRSLVLGRDAGVEIPASLHEPIEQALVVCSKGAQRQAGVAFAELVRSAEGQAVLRRAGFGP
jgi:molybdate transport system substrate-binding protein